VGAAFTATAERNALDDPTLISPADADQLEQERQDDDRRLARQRARDKAARN
jgi:hypothetical protein